MSTETQESPTSSTSAHELTSGRLLARNATGNLISQCLPMAVAILSMPWLIRGLGTDRFGIMTLSWMILGYFSLFDLGLGRALTKLVAEKLGRDEIEHVPPLIWTAMLLMTALGLVGTLFVLVVTPWLVIHALKIHGPLRAEALGSFYLMGVTLPFLIGTSGLRGVLEAKQRLAGANVVRTATSLFILVGPLVVLLWTRNLIAVVGFICLVRFASWCVHVILCLRVIPELRERIDLRRDFVVPLLSFGGWMTAVNIINPLMVQMDRFLVGAFVSTAAVAYYTTPYELITKAWFLSNAVLGVIFPAFATSYVRDRVHTAEIFERCLKYVGIILFPITLISMAISREILGLWLGADFAAQSTPVLQWLALGVFLCGLAQVPSALIQGIGRPDLTFKLHMIELPPYLIAAWFLIGAWGIEGAAVAWTARTVLDLGLYFVAGRAVLPQIAPGLRRLAPLFVGSLACLALVALPFGLPFRAVGLVLSLIVFLVVTWKRLLTDGERALVLNQAERVLGRLAPASLRMACTARE